MLVERLKKCLHQYLPFGILSALLSTLIQAICLLGNLFENFSLSLSGRKPLSEMKTGKQINTN